MMPLGSVARDGGPPCAKCGGPTIPLFRTYVCAVECDRLPTRLTLGPGPSLPRNYTWYDSLARAPVVTDPVWIKRIVHRVCDCEVMRYLVSERDGMPNTNQLWQHGTWSVCSYAAEGPGRRARVTKHYERDTAATERP